jgi:RimJ/RimL family protein N-acetyltransferase
MTVLTTPRLTLRNWRETDLLPFAALNADAATMEFMPRCLTRAESDELARLAQSNIGRRGWGLWALEVQESQEFIGCVGLTMPAFRAHFTPCIACDWRLKRASWGRGYATEAARECLRFAFENLVLPEVLAFTVPANARSRAVMERLGMSRDLAGDFEHPRLPPGHALRHHVLYRLTAQQWATSRLKPSAV